jgi:predicted RNA-binding protein YlqC (UPF0109 family)
MYMTDVEYLTAILEPLLEEPQNLSVTRTVDDMGVLLTVQCGRNDMGRVIGKEGSTAKAVRCLMRIYGIKEDARINVKLLEPEGSIFRKKRDLDSAINNFTGTPIHS